MTRRRLAIVFGFVFLLPFAGSAHAARLHVAVFNFQMTSATPAWVWLEKGLADKITTDFTRSRRITVVARDRMQLLARQLRWAPEMATGDPAGMGRIRKALKVDYLVTGVFAVRGKQVEITSQLIRVEGRKEVARKVVRGGVENVLDLQRQISAELLSWFSGVPAERILPHLPIWTTSIPATRALYKGMHLYDQGRYTEAWLHFRTAWRNDPTYLEAHYWVARMYYFMDRYAHARRAYERFVYMDQTHPRIGDAIKEYLHSHEKLGEDAETLLTLYNRFRRRFPDAMIYNELDVPIPVRCATWLDVRRAQVLHRNGKHAEAARLAAGAVDMIRERYWQWGWEGWAYGIARRAAQSHNLQTGRVVMPKALLEHHGKGEQVCALRFSPAEREAMLTLREPKRSRPQRAADGKQVYPWIFFATWVLAPDGYAFRRLTAYPIITGDDGQISCYMRREVRRDAGEVPFMPIGTAREQGLTFASIPRGGVFDMAFSVKPNHPNRDPQLTVRGLRVVAELEKLRAYGSLRVSCTNTDNFLVYVDGRRERRGIGTIGLVEPGRHTLEFRPISEQTPLASTRRVVETVEGRTAEVRIAMPWRKGTPVSGWVAAQGIGRDYPVWEPCLQTNQDAPAVQADDHAIRAFWSYRGDLWSALSTDGERFSLPARLPMPVSSGWMEEHPQCIRDESGRFLLAFKSDREGQHQLRGYVCWSRDGRRWSRPSMVVDRTVDAFDLIQDRSGRFLWAAAAGTDVSVMASRNGYQWEPLAQWTLTEEWANDIRILQRDDGGLELHLASHRFLTPDRNWQFAEMSIWQYRSRLGRRWAPRQRVWKCTWEDKARLSAIHRDGETTVAWARTGVKDVRIFRKSADGSWRRAKALYGVTTWNTRITHHPKWGYMFIWHRPLYILNLTAVTGPFLVRGPSLDVFFDEP